MFGLLGKLVDRYHEAFDPERYYRRMNYRAAVDRSNALSYRSARSRRLGSSLNGRGGSGDAHLSTSDLNTMRELSRALDRDNLFASSIMDRLCESVIGTGINVTVDSGNKRWDQQVIKLWDEWWNGNPEVRGMFAGRSLESIIYRGGKVDGDMLIVKLNDGRIQIIEGDRIQTPPVELKNPNVVNGVKLNDVGAIVSFYVTQSIDKRVGHTQEFREYKAEDCVFIAERHRHSMTRGVPLFTRNLDLFKDIDEFTNASIVQQKVSASHCMFVERKGGLNGIDGVTTEVNHNGIEQQQQYIEAGIIMYGELGESAHMLGTGQTGQQFSPFVTQLLRFAGLSYGLPLEILSLDFSKTTFSSARASIQVAQRCFIKEQRAFLTSVIKPILNWKIRQWIRKGLIMEPSGTYTIGATPPKAISIDPLKETNADIARINAGLTTMRDVCASNGVNWNDNLRQRETEIKSAGKIAKNIVKGTGEDWGARDIIGISQGDAYAQQESIQPTPE